MADSSQLDKSKNLERASEAGTFEQTSPHDKIMQIGFKPTAAAAKVQHLVRNGVLRIACFFGFVILMVYGANSLITFGLHRITTGQFGVFNRIMNGQVNADILITGSSRAMVDYDPQIIGGDTDITTFNIGLNGSQTDMQVALLKAYLHHNKAPRLLIHNLDLFSFQTSHGGVYDPGQYLPYLKEHAIYEALISIDPQCWKSKYLPMYGYVVEDMRLNWITGVKGLFGLNPTEDHHLGFVPRQRAWTGEFDAFQESHSHGVEFGIEPKGEELISDMIELCQRKGITVVLVYSPEFFEMQALEKNRSEVFKRFHDLQERYGVLFWDYSKSEISSNRSLFYNSQHLNAKGAELFSKELAERLQSSADVAAVLKPRTLRQQAGN